MRFRKGGLILIAVASSLAVWAGNHPYIEGTVRTARPEGEGIEREVVADLNADFLCEALRGKTLQLSALPFPDGNPLDVELEEFSPLSPECRIVEMTERGAVDHPPPGDRKYFRGRTSEPGGSVAFFEIAAGVFQGFVRARGRVAVYGIRKDGDGKPLLAASFPGREAPPPRCLSDQLPDRSASPAHPLVWELPSLLDATPLTGQVALEMDYETYVHFGSVSAASSYGTSLLGAVSAIYQAEIHTALQAVSIRVWSTAGDPYSDGSDPVVLLGELRTEYLNNMAGVQRVSAHLLAKRSGMGGVAYVSTLCDTDVGYGVDGVEGTYSYPTTAYTWDADCLAHELGHNFGSLHTHCYGTNVGLADWIDRCYAQEGGCFSGTVVDPPMAEKTIMSYCHLLPPYEVSMTLVDRYAYTSARIRAGAEAAPCMLRCNTLALASDPSAGGGAVIGTPPNCMTSPAFLADEVPDARPAPGLPEAWRRWARGEGRVDYGMTFERRLEAQARIERFWHLKRSWPKDNPGPKPTFEEVMTPGALAEKVRDYLERSRAFERREGRPLTEAELDAELERVQTRTRDRTSFEALLAALGSDPELRRECLARPLLVDRLSGDPTPDTEWPQPLSGAPDTWNPTGRGAGCPSGRTWLSDSIWTGAEMIVWGGDDGTSYVNTGGRYNPTTDSWAATSVGLNCPGGRIHHTAVWTGVEMIIMGGWNGSSAYNTGGRYNPATDSWRTMAADEWDPYGHSGQTAVWTGTEMIIWGGGGGGLHNNGCRYNPDTDSWTPVSTGTNCPAARSDHAAVWTGTEMIVWGGYNGSYLNTGGRYDPATDSWAPTSTGASCATARESHRAVWTGKDMIIWGGWDGNAMLNTGGRYDPVSDSWASTSVGSGCPAGRHSHTAVWTGAEMIVWGGYGWVSPGYQNTGGRYSPASDSWTPTPQGSGCPTPRYQHTAVWTGTEMIVWGGWYYMTGYNNTGGRYTPSAGASGYMSNTAVALFARPAPGHTFDSWSSTGGGTFADPYAAETTFTVLGDATLTAHFTCVLPAPGAPTLLSASGTCDGISLEWSAGTGTVDSFSVVRSNACGGAATVLVSGIPPTWTSFLDAGAELGTTYTYWVLAANPCGASPPSNCSAGARLASPFPTVAGHTSGCSDPGETLSTQAFSTYQWMRDGVDIGGATGPTHVATASGTYAVRVTNQSGCTGTSPGVPVTLSAPEPTATAGPPACGSVTVSTGSYASYQWYRNSVLISGATSQSYAATQSGTYSVAVTDANGCRGISSGVALTVYPLPTPSVGGPTTGCANPGVTLTAGSYSSYIWRVAPAATAYGLLVGATCSGTAGNDYYYDVLASPAYTIQAGDVLEYDIYGYGTNPEFRAAVDLIAPGWVLRGSGAVDQNGLGAQPGIDLASKMAGKWYHRSIAIPSSGVGKSLSGTGYGVFLGIEDEAAGSYNVYVTNLKITNGGVPQLTVYGGGSSFTFPSDAGYSFGSGYTVTQEALIIGGAHAAGTTSCLARGTGDYRVYVTDGNGCGAWSAPYVVTLSPGPASPANSLRVTPSGSAAALGWSACAGATSYLVMKNSAPGTNPNGFTTVGTPATNSYADGAAISAGQVWWYKVEASDGTCATP